MITFPVHILLEEDPEEAIATLPLRVQKLVRSAVELMNAAKKGPRAEELVEIVVEDTERPFCIMGLIRVEFGDGKPAQFHSVKLGGNGVTILAFTEANTVLVVHPERPLQVAGLWGAIPELPQGFIEPNESPLMAARRELLEETGFEPVRLVELGIIRPTGYLLGQNHVVLALGCRKVAEPKPEKSERFGQLTEMSRDDLREFLVSGKPVDGFLATAWAMHEARQG